jgi:putative intracellular protease/amidase
MKKSILIIPLVLFTAISLFAQQRILIISTNVDSVGNNRSGTYLPEIAYPFKTFTDKGYLVDIVTPAGGKASIYEAKTESALASIRDSKAFIDKTTNTLSPGQVDPSKYKAVYVPGGHGQFFDVASDERIAIFIARIYEAGGVIGTAGHGTASIVNVKLSDCSFLVSRKRITTFPSWAEERWMNISNYGKLLPFCMQELLQRRGAYLVITEPETNDDADRTRVVDKANRFVTGSYANSAGWVSEEMIKMF